MKLVIDIPEEYYKTIMETKKEIVPVGWVSIRNGIQYKERPHGKWKFVDVNLFMCTNCGYIANAKYLRDWKAYAYDAEFPTSCLKCGADMREGDENGEQRSNIFLAMGKTETALYTRQKEPTNGI